MKFNKTVNLIAIQITGEPDIDANLKKLEALVAEACDDCGHNDNNEALVLFPECASMFGCSGKQMLAKSETLGNGEAQAAFSEMAKRFKVHLIAGSMPIKREPVQGEDDKYFASSIAYDPQGERIGVYNKLHLFDVDVEDSTGSYHESKYTEFGKSIEVLDLEWGRVGQSICYDLRFPNLYAAMDFPDVIVVPSAFTKVTGQAHWHTLLKARAIENQAYVVAANQWGIHQDGRETFGNSCIYSPWGERLSNIESGEGFAFAKFEMNTIEKIRRSMPVSKHRLEKYE